jgi:hypothetical protein
MELQAVTGQLHVVDGEAQSATAIPGLLAQSAPARAARGRERDFLFVHLALTGKTEETSVLSQDLLDAISRRFYQSSGSVTAALRRAVVEANDLLLRLNLSGVSPSREGAITCAALHNGELFMLQTGEALALLGHNFGVERLPQDTPDHITPLGRTAGIDIRYFHHQLQASDMLLLADPRIANLPVRTLAPALVDTEVEYGLAELQEIMGSESARLLLVEFTDRAPAELPDVPQPIDATGEALTAVAEPAPQREPGITLPVTAPQTTGARRRPQSATPSRYRSAAGTEDSGRPTTSMEHTARRATSDAAMGLSRFTEWLARLFSRLRPTRSDAATGVALPTIIAVSIPIIVAVVVSGVYLQRGRVRRFAQIKVEMGQNLALAQEVEGSQGAARNHYDAMLVLATEAEQLRPGDAEIRRLRLEALAALDLLDDVTRLSSQLFYEYDEGVNLAAVVLREGFNGGVYALDVANNTVYEHETDESYLVPTDADPQRIVFGGQAVGSHVVNQIVDMMWRSRGSAVTRDGLAILDRVGTVLTYYPNFADIRAVPLGLASDWRLPSAITSYDERLYVLDTGMSEIWKYFPDGDGFVLKETERTVVFSEDPGLAKSIDFEIYSEDGSLVMLYQDGRLRYYDTRSGRVQWDEIHLMQNGLSTPLIAPKTIKLVGRGLNASIYISDPGSGRIIQVSRGGTVLAQYRATDSDGRELFAGINDFAVAETPPLRIFVAAGNELHVVVQD